MRTSPNPIPNSSLAFVPPPARAVPAEVRSAALEQPPPAVCRRFSDVAGSLADAKAASQADAKSCPTRPCVSHDIQGARERRTKCAPPCRESRQTGRGLTPESQNGLPLEPRRRWSRDGRPANGYRHAARTSLRAGVGRPRSPGHRIIEKPKEGTRHRPDRPDGGCLCVAPGNPEPDELFFDRPYAMLRPVSTW